MLASARKPLSFFTTFFCCSAIVFCTVRSWAAPVVTVISPRPGTTSGSPVFFEAYATSSACPQGISSLRIYTAPHVVAFSNAGGRLETFLKLNPGTYNAVVQAWDKCGVVGKTAVTITVDSTPGISVFVPNATSPSSPVHVAASTQNSSCAAGISAIRIYTSNGTSPYTIRSSQLDAYINLVPGSYNLTVQAWDNCGHVFKTVLSKAITTTTDAYLYAVNQNASAPNIYQFQVAANGALLNPNGTGTPPTFAAGTGADTLATDPGGWFLYASTIDNIYGYQIEPVTGRLRPMPGSPFRLNDVNNIVAPLIEVDPSGNFLLARYGGAEVGRARTYRINRSTGALTSTGYVIGTDWYTHTFDLSGQYLYFIAYGGQIDGYRLNPNNGEMALLPGSPFMSNSINSIFLPSMTSTARYLYVGGANPNVAGFNINYATGTLTEMAGSPFATSSPNRQVFGVLADRLPRFLWTLQQDTLMNVPGLETFAIARGSGALTANPAFVSLENRSLAAWVEDHSGKFVFTSFSSAAPNRGIATWAISANGDLQLASMYSTANPIGSVAVARRVPN